MMYAQTNVQLFNQLQRNGYTSIDLQRIADAYKMAMQLFTGLYRPSGEPFIIHQIGTASILADLQRPAEVVAAGLVHAAYTHGDFGNQSKGISKAKRAQVRRAVGSNIEEYIARYTAFVWKPRKILTVRDKLIELDSIDRDVVVMRLADVLEKFQDEENLYSCERNRVRRYLDSYGPVMVDIAAQLGYPGLAAELKTAFRQAVSSTTAVSLELYNVTSRSFTDLVAPRSYRRQLGIVLHLAVTRWLHFARARAGLRTRLRKLIRCQ